jgi:hypothetical protein
MNPAEVERLRILHLQNSQSHLEAEVERVKKQLEEEKQKREELERLKKQ